MPSLTFELSKEQKKRKKDKPYPIAIVKGDNKKFHNKMLYIDPSDGCGNGENDISIPMGCCFNLIPSTDEDKRDVFYISGSSGSGKSWIAKQLAENYIKLYPDREVYVVSKLEEDNTLDSMNLGKGRKPIRLDYSFFVEDPPDINALSNSLIIFDDYDTITGKEGKSVHELIEDIAIMGRKHNDNQGNVSMLCLSHFSTNFRKTRIILSEANYFVVFPQATSNHALTYLLKTHLGFDKEDIKDLRKMGRWVSIHKSYPAFLIAGQRAKLLHQA